MVIFTLIPFYLLLVSIYVRIYSPRIEYLLAGVIYFLGLLFLYNHQGLASFLYVFGIVVSKYLWNETEQEES